MDTRTYLATEEGGTTTRDIIVGHEHFPCPPTRGEVETCDEAWTEWVKTAPLKLTRARTRPRLGPPQRSNDG